MYYYIYIITNKITHKQYVGQHQCNSIDNEYYGSSKTLNSDIELLGKRNFSKKILEIFSDNKFLDFIEAYYIGKYNTFEKGYNKTRTGSIDRMSIVIPRIKTYKYICPVCGKKANDERFKSLHFDNCQLKEEGDYLCPHCLKTGHTSSFKYSHFDLCKYRKVRIN
jgi:hypothetical protein